MKICHVASGRGKIPPDGWGAIQALVWDYKFWIEKFGHEFHVVNLRNKNQIVRQVNASEPDVVHIHDGGYFLLAQHMNSSLKILTTHDSGVIYSPADRRTMLATLYGLAWTHKDLYVCCLSELMRRHFMALGIPSARLFVAQNGARSDLIRFTEKPRHPDRSICLGQVTRRKRQYLLQDVRCVDVIGQACNRELDYSRISYLGEWSKQEVYSNLTEYVGMVLLSRAEAAPLAVCEALMAGLGLVLSESAAANLDLTQPFIDIVPEARIGDKEYLASIILKNQLVAREMRRAIRQYAMAHFDWEGLVASYLNKLGSFLNGRAITSACQDEV
jgi:glycosyltransferase involved in cell wall biosynthesis